MRPRMNDLYSFLAVRLNEFDDRLNTAPLYKASPVWLYRARRKLPRFREARRVVPESRKLATATDLFICLEK